MKLQFLIKISFLIFISTGFSNVISTGTQANIISLPLTAQELASAGAITSELNSFSLFKNPVKLQTNQRQIGYNFNSFYTGEFHSSIILLPQIPENFWIKQIGFIYLSIPNIPDTGLLFSENDEVPNYNSISNFSFNQYGILLNYNKKYNDRISYGINFIPHFYNLYSDKAVGIIFNIATFLKFNPNLNYTFLINSFPGSFTVWNEKQIELLPLELKNCLTYEIRKISIFSNINYTSENVSIFNSKFWNYNGLDYSLGINFKLNSNIKFTISNGSKLNFGGGFLFSYNGIDIQYGVAIQNIDSFRFLHHGIDFVFDLNKIEEWQNILQP